jgi:hypothetical protein
MGVNVCAEFHRCGCGSAWLLMAGVSMYAWLPSPMVFERKLTSAFGWFKMPPALDGLNEGQGFGHWSWRASPISKCDGMRLGALPRLCPCGSAHPSSGGADFLLPLFALAMDEETVLTLTGATMEDARVGDARLREKLREVASRVGAPTSLLAVGSIACPLSSVG